MRKMLGQRRKTKDDVKAIQRVQQAAESAVRSVVLYVSKAKRPTSEEAHKIINEVLEKFGCESPEGHIVAGGKQSAAPHEKGTGLLKRGEPIVIDIYPRSKKTGYFADMSRTVCLGKPSPKLQKMYDTVLQAQELAISMIKPGVKGKDIHNAVKNFFDKEGFLTSGKGKEFTYAEGFVHGLGHGVGLKVHEDPKLSEKSEDVLMEGDVVTIEPGLYYKNIGGVRIEDMVLVTKNGYRNLTNFNKEFVC